MPVPMMSMRDYTLRTKSGHVIFFAGGKTTMVPDEAVVEAQAVNVVVCDNVDPEQKLAFKATAANNAITGTLRDAIVFSAIDDLVRSNDPADFNAGGQPKVHTVTDATGIKLGGGEVSKYWERYRELKATNSPLPEHPRAEHVLELNRLTTRTQLLEYAKNLDFDTKVLERKSLKEVKELLVYATINQNEAVFAHATTPGGLDTSSLAEND